MIVLYVLAALILLLAAALIACVLAIAIRTYRNGDQLTGNQLYVNDTDPDTQNGTRP